MNGTRIKICGLFRAIDGEYINRAMPDYAGFVFYQKSHRGVSLEQAQELRKIIDPRIKTVGVFVDAPLVQIVELYHKKIITIIQLHGKEDNGFIAKLRELLSKAEIWKTFQIRTTKDVDEAAKTTADMVLLDNGYGTGKSFDWSLIKDFPRPFILAGGLTPENIPDAVSTLRPYGVDISSGVECNGVKDKYKILSAVSAVRS